MTDIIDALSYWLFRGIEFGGGYLWVALFLILAMSILAVVDIILNLNGIEVDNINYLLHKWSFGKSYFIPFAWGLLVGHLFLGTSNPWIYNKVLGLEAMTIGIIGAAVLTLALILIGRKWPVQEGRKSSAFLISLMFFGMFYGHFFWSMNYITP